jgi:hypothetical protein
MLSSPPLFTDDDVAAIDGEIKRAGFSIARPEGFVTLCEAARAEYLEAFERSPLQPPKKKFVPSDLARGPWRKLTIGSRNGVGENYAQALQTTYFDCTVPPYGALNAVFRFMNELRNRLMQVALDFGDQPARDKFWNACRVHHYPRGGGFMMMHRDTHFPIKLGDLPFYQVMVPLSVLGRDFVEGGGVLVTRQGEKINTDEAAGLGAVVLFDGRIQHAVEDVDPQATMDFADPLGRLAAFSNLYVTPPA